MPGGPFCCVVRIDRSISDYLVTFMMPRIIPQGAGMSIAHHRSLTYCCSTWGLNGTLVSRESFFNRHDGLDISTDHLDVTVGLSDQAMYILLPHRDITSFGGHFSL